MEITTTQDTVIRVQQLDFGKTYLDIVSLLVLIYTVWFFWIKLDCVLCWTWPNEIQFQYSVKFTLRSMVAFIYIDPQDIFRALFVHFSFTLVGEMLILCS